MRIQNLLRFPDSLHRRANNLTFSGIESDASPTRQDSSLDRLPAGNVTHQVGRQVSAQQRNKSAFRESATDGSAESTCDDDLNFQDMRSLFQDLDLDRDSELQITKWSLQFTNESLEEEFMMRRADKNKPHIIIISLITLILAICFTGLYYLEGSTTLVGFGIVIIFCIANFLAYVRYSRHYVRFYSKSANIFYLVSSLLILSSRIVKHDRTPSVVNTTITMVFLTWMRGRFSSSVKTSLLLFTIFLLGSCTYMNAWEIVMNVFPFSLSTAAQILVAYHLERNDRRLFRTRKLDAEYKSRLLAKEAKTNDILRKTYPPFVADELRSASSLHSLSHTSKHALIIHMRIHFGIAQASLNSEQSAQVFTWLREFQVFVDKLCRRSEVKNLCKVKFSGDMTLMVCGIGQPMTKIDVENTIRLIDQLVLHVQSRHSAKQARLVVVASIGPVEGGIVVCQKQSYDVYGAGLSSSLVLLDRVWLSSEHGQSLFVVTTDVCNHAEGEYDKVTVDGVSSSQQLYQRVSLRIASKSKRHKEGTTDETQAESGALRVMHERIYDDEASESTKSVSLGAQEDGHGLCLLPGEAARYEQDFQLIADRESYLHQLKLLKAAVPYVSMLVLWSIYWGSMEYSIFVDAGIQSIDEIMQLMFVRFFVILPCIVLWTAWCGFEIGWLEREPDGFALQCFTFGLLCCVVVQGLFVSFKVFLLYRISMEVDDLNFYHHYFFNNEFLLWVLLSTSVSISTSRLSRYSAIYWIFVDSSVQLMFPSETGYSSFFSVVVTVIIYSIMIGIVIFYQGNTVTLTRNQQVESNILIQKVSCLIFFLFSVSHALFVLLCMSLLQVSALIPQPMISSESFPFNPNIAEFL
eukprot:TRINITY_DN1537_c0_g1_i11.p1 TRINITY_DN1537_c0_g1~~TRINITY_DN1537_c0_g1_i11.p1  ORF type:complete len:861 (-),score=144.20 TRINITY_DN1537_c0_g1_i11:863-3445(-)